MLFSRHAAAVRPIFASYVYAHRLPLFAKKHDMTENNPTSVKAKEIVKTLKTHVWLWVIPVLVCGLAAGAYAFFKAPSWEATQALVLRDEATGEPQRKGRFENNDAMRNAQETVLEMARNTNVLSHALQKIGPPSGHPDSEDWPTPKAIADIRKLIAIKPPKGGEFGSTEVVYLSVQAETPDRAAALADAVFGQLVERMQELRNRRAHKLIDELEKAVEITTTDLDAASENLKQIEVEVGVDLHELVGLKEGTADGSSLHSAIIDIDDELRAAKSQRRDNQILKQHLSIAQKDPAQLVAMPNTLLLSQPALQRLKDGLVDSQLREATVLSRFTANHPQVKEAKDEVQKIRDHIHRELDVAIRGLTADLEIGEARVAVLMDQRKELEVKLDWLAGLRVRYFNLEDERTRRSQILEQAQKDLSIALAARAASQSASLITRIDQPEVADAPVGPGKSVIGALGGILGLAIGFGLVFLFAPTAHGESIGRRWGDRIRGRRATDGAASSQPQGEPARRGEDRPVTDGCHQPSRRTGDWTVANESASDVNPPTQKESVDGERRGGGERRNQDRRNS
jgi:uncharacterized protein involved in exopolysaccharide biosynthesis